MDDDANPYEAPTVESGAAAHPVSGRDDLVLASRWTRLLAAIFDNIATSVVTWLIVAFVVSFDRGGRDSRLPSYVGQIVVAAAFLGSFMTLHGYLLATSAQTLFKKLFRIQIATPDGCPAGFRRIVGLRLLPLWVVASIPFLGGLAVIVDALFIFRGNRRCLHDELANTIVIRLP